MWLLVSLLGTALLLAGCNEPPEFVRFDRGEAVSMEVTRDRDDNCNVSLWLYDRPNHRSYAARLKGRGC